MEAIEASNEARRLKLDHTPVADPGRRGCARRVVSDRIRTRSQCTKRRQHHCRSRPRHGRRRVDFATRRQQQCRNLDSDDELPDIQRVDDARRRGHGGVHQRWRQPRRAGGLHHRQRGNPPVGESELQHRALREWQLRWRRRTANGCIATAQSTMARSPIRPTASWYVRVVRRAPSLSACASTIRT